MTDDELDIHALELAEDIINKQIDDIEYLTITERVTELKLPEDDSDRMIDRVDYYLEIAVITIDIPVKQKGEQSADNVPHVPIQEG